MFKKENIVSNDTSTQNGLFQLNYFFEEKIRKTEPKRKVFLPGCEYGGS